MHNGETFYSRTASLGRRPLHQTQAEACATRTGLKTGRYTNQEADLFSTGYRSPITTHLFCYAMERSTPFPSACRKERAFPARTHRKFTRKVLLP